MRTVQTFVAVLICAALAPVVNAATVNFVETPSNRLSTNGNTPTILGTFGVGANTVSGNVSGAQLSIANGRNSDIFTFTIDPGTQLDSLVSTSYAGSNISYAGLTRGAVFPYDNAGLNALNPPSNNYSGIGLIGFQNNQTFFDETQNDFSLFATFYGSAGFTAPLGPDTYTFYVQETGQGGSPATYTLRFNVSSVAIPEPSSFAVLGLASALGVVRRRRRA